MEHPPPPLDRTWKTDAGPWTLEARRTAVGDDQLVVVSGGDRPHLGAWGRSADGQRIGPADFPGHRDAALVQIFLDALESLGPGWVVLAGVHVDRASAQDLAVILEGARRLAATVAQDLAREAG
jgi:hypothetical protein